MTATYHWRRLPHHPPVKTTRQRREPLTDLGDFGKCKICGAYSFLRGHRCTPVWYVMLAKESPHYCGDDVPWKIRAQDGQDAAEKFTEQQDIVGGEQITVTVWPKGTPDDKQTFTVRGEMVQKYWDEEVTGA